jgi:hypothetical protein
VLSLSAVSALAVFVALGLGFALPFLLLGLWPRLLSFIPKPGAWMLTFKQFLAFPMYAAAAWLVWVLAQEAGPRGVALVLGAMILLALAAWLWSSPASQRTRTSHRGGGRAGGADWRFVWPGWFAGQRRRTSGANQQAGRTLWRGQARQFAGRQPSGVRGRHRRLVHYLFGQ